MKKVTSKKTPAEKLVIEIPDIRRTGRARLLPIPVAERMMKPKELQAALQRMDEDAFQAVTQFLQTFIDSAKEQLSNPNMAAHHGALAHTVGGFSWLEVFQGELHQRRRGFSPTKKKGETDLLEDAD